MDLSAFFKFSYGLYLVCSHDGDHFNGHVSNTVFQVTADPPQFVISTHKDNLTTRYIRKSKVFSVSVLQQDITLEFLGPWGFKSGKDTEKFRNISYKTGITGVPVVLEKSVAYLECRVMDEIDTGTHILFVGLAVDAKILDEYHKPLTYSHYREVIKGLSPEHSPTFTGEKSDKKTHAEVATEEPKHKKYRCTVCGFIYDPEEGDPDSGIAPGTAFEDIPEDWECPICGVTKKDFVVID